VLQAQMCECLNQATHSRSNEFFSSIAADLKGEGSRYPAATSPRKGKANDKDTTKKGTFLKSFDISLWKDLNQGGIRRIVFGHRGRSNGKLDLSSVDCARQVACGRTHSER
jgi:hypothetical protein